MSSNMDRPRTRSRIPSKKQLFLIGLGLMIVLAVVIAQVAWNQEGIVDLDELVLTPASKGTFEVTAYGSGELSPSRYEWVTAKASGLAQQILVFEGDSVEQNEPIVLLGNLELERSYEQSELEIQRLRAQSQVNEVEMQNTKISLNLSRSLAASRYEEAKLQLTAAEDLFSKSAISDIDFQLKQIQERNAEIELQVANTKLENFEKISAATENLESSALASKELEVQTLRDSVNSLIVVSPIAGIVQEINVELGQEVRTGAQIGQIAGKGSLQPVVRVPERFANDIVGGLDAEVTVLGRTLKARVTRVNPSVVNGNVTVNLSLIDELPTRARADQSVSAVVKLHRIDATVYVTRPSGVVPNSEKIIYVYDESNDRLNARTVTFGIESGSSIQVLQGLEADEVVVRNDTRSFDGAQTLAVR